MAFSSMAGDGVVTHSQLSKVTIVFLSYDLELEMRMDTSNSHFFAHPLQNFELEIKILS